MTRETLNGMIRFTHQINIFFLIVIYVMHTLVFKHRRATDYEHRFEIAINALSSEKRELITDTIREAHHTILRHIMSTSPFLWLITKPLSFILKVAKVTEDWNKTALDSQRVKYTWRVLDAEANFTGADNCNNYPAAA